MERLTKRTPNGAAYMAIADTLPKADQEIEGSKPILEGLYAMFQKLAKYEDLDEKLPEIVCLCGSTRFFKTFDEQNFKLTLEGKIVLSIGCNTKSDEGLKLTSEDKIRLDELHKRKIDLCNYILVLNVDGYIGDSTKSEIAYAERIGKPVKYLY